MYGKNNSSTPPNHPYLKIHQSKEVHPDEWVSPTPHIDEHDGEGLPQEQHVHQQRAEHHADGAEREHDDEVAGPAAERAVLQVAAVAVGEYQVEEKGEAHRSKEEERSDYPPYLPTKQQQKRLLSAQMGCFD